MDAEAGMKIRQVSIDGVGLAGGRWAHGAPRERSRSRSRVGSLGAGRAAVTVALAAAAALMGIAAPAVVRASSAQATGFAPLQSLPSLEVPPYMGTWYQVALFPNRFQAQCVSDTTATYRQLPDGSVEVANRCRTADGRLDEAMGRARPTGALRGTTLAPAQLQVSFLPEWIRWLPVGWGTYWVVQLATDGRYAVVSEPTRQYLWVLSRTPRLTPEDETAIRSRLIEQGFAAALARWQAHPHGPSSR
jgi:apolipoprotein D and lipocalin family protein